MYIKKSIINVLQKYKTMDLLFNFLKNPSKNFVRFFPDTESGAKLFYNSMKLFNLKQYKKRLLLKKSFLEDCNRIKTINNDAGYTRLNLKENKYLNESIKISNNILNKSAENNFLDFNKRKPFLFHKQINILDKKLVSLKKLITSKIFLGPIVEYLGSFPVLWSSSIWFSPNKEIQSGRSQQFHLDNEDIKQVKCFVPLDTINEENGPLTIIDAKKTTDTFKTLYKLKIIKKKNTKISDEVFYSVQNPKNAIKLTAKIGDILLVDTSRCYHYGSRPAPKTRKLLFFQFFSINSRKISLSQGSLNQYLSDHIERELFKFYKVNKCSDYH